ncbi:MAG: 4-hydroxythreonine-4-phosphate dehydrogenase PdxA [Boseongicola sp.]|nr:MAG: 4-hydroxythreonine-4-phosphate dehydrogenase PdxA [Boseongicola sp.]
MRQSVALTCGDPAGIGPEIAIKARQALKDQMPFFWIGDPRHLPAETSYQVIETPAEVPDVSSTKLPVLRHDFPCPATPGNPTPENASSIVTAIERAVSLVKSGQVSGLCTSPISKKILVDHADFKHPGHTEFLAHLAGQDRSVMMLASSELRVVPATIHIPLRDVRGALTPNVLEYVLRTTLEALHKDFGLLVPRIAVAGLNPHAGEGGILGDEELEFIAPLCEKLRKEGHDVIGPLPADTMFHAAARSTYDAAVAMYHDQALIPIKTIAFDTGVNTTLGLPFIRTSPDHGTAFDIAGKGIANPNSLIEALKLADSMAQVRKKSLA